MNTPADQTADKLHDLLWRVRLSALYHLKRERFLDGMDRSAKVVSALGGATAFAFLKSNHDYGLWATGFIAITSALSLVYSPSTKARKHADLAKDFKLLEADILGKGDGITWLDLAAFEGRYVRIEASEPASLGALVTQCHNELAAAMGQNDHITPLPLIDRLFKNWVDIDQSPPVTPIASNSPKT